MACAPTAGERVTNALGYAAVAFVIAFCGQILVWFWPVPLLFYVVVSFVDPEGPWFGRAFLVIPVVASVVAAHRGWRLGDVHALRARRAARLTTRSESRGRRSN